MIAVAPESLPKVEAMEAAHHVTWDLTDDYGPSDTIIGIKDGDWRKLPTGLFTGLPIAQAAFITQGGATYGVWAEPYHDDYCLFLEGIP